MKRITRSRKDAIRKNEIAKYLFDDEADSPYIASIDRRRHFRSKSALLEDIPENTLLNLPAPITTNSPTIVSNSALALFDPFSPAIANPLANVTKVSMASTSASRFEFANKEMETNVVSENDSTLKKVLRSDAFELKLGKVVTKSLKAALEPLQTQISTLSDKIGTNHEELEASIKISLEPITKSMNELELKTKNLSDNADASNTRITKLEKGMLDHEQSKRVNNLIFNAVEEKAGETLEERICNIANSVGVKIEPWDLSDCFRLGKPDETRTKPRPILVRFTRQRMKRDIYAARLKLKEGEAQIFANEDLIPSRSKLLWEVRKFGSLHKLSSWTQNHVIQYKVKGSTDVPKSILDDSELEKLKNEFNK